MSDVTLQFRPSVSGDDGYHNSTTFYNSATSAYFGKTTAICSAFFKFNNIVIPKNSVIVSAYLKYTPVAEAGTPKLHISANDTVDPVAPTSITQYNALATTAGVAWETAVGSGVSPDIKDIIQTLVSKTDWAINKNILLIVKDDGSSDNNYCQGNTYDNGNATLPILEITWTLPSYWHLLNSGASGDDGFTGSEFAGGYEDYFDNTSAYLRTGTAWVGSSQNIPMNFNTFQRFPTANLANGLIISEAYLVVTTKTAQGATYPLNDTIYFNAADNAVAPANKTQSDALVVTSGIPWTNYLTAAEKVFTSPNIATILQEVIDRTGWTANNALMVIIRSTQIGAAWQAPYSDYYSYNNGSKYPQLLIYAPPTTGNSISERHLEIAYGPTNLPVDKDIIQYSEAMLSYKVVQPNTLRSDIMSAGLHIADAKVDYTAGDLDTEAKIITALNTTNGKINDILAALETNNILASS